MPKIKSLSNQRLIFNVATRVVDLVAGGATVVSDEELLLPEVQGLIASGRLDVAETRAAETKAAPPATVTTPEERVPRRKEG
jgi:hypothetical protein